MHSSRARTTAIVGIVILVAVGAAAWFLVLAPRMSTASEITTQAEQVEMTNLALTNRYNQTLVEAKKAPQAAAEAQQLFSAMPQEADLPGVLQQITDAASRAGIMNEQLQMIETSVPQPVRIRGGQDATISAAAKSAGVNLARLPLAITANAPRPALLKFLENLQGLDRAVLVSETMFTGGDATRPSDATSSESLHFTGSMFVLQSKLPDLVASVDELLKQAQLGGQPTP